MLKKHKQFIRVFAIFLVLVIFANIVIPNISFASSYDDLKALVTEIENDQTLASTVYTNFLYSKDPRPTKEVYGDEYVDAMTERNLQIQRNYHKQMKFTAEIFMT